MIYRKEIDGLRALAVLPVILFHAGFEIFGGGFVGVDIFFVISGYLITSIIVEEMEKGSFSLLNFYERRARRILPALFFVMFCTLPFAWFWMIPQDFKSFSQSLVAVPLFASNVLFWLSAGYFASTSELKPLLHTWSLSVEEQFYIIFPLFLLLMWKLGKIRITSILFFFTILSLGIAEWASSTHPALNFYLLPTRGFEILIGCIISFLVYNKEFKITLHESLESVLSIIGFILILYAIFSFNKNTPFPSVYTLIPTIGTGLILLFANNQNLVGKLLSSKILVGVGLISYSSYLWHQPLFAFLKLRSIDEPSDLLLGFMTIMSLFLGYLSWKYVENPFRNTTLIKRNSVFLYGFLATVFFVAAGLFGHFTNGYEQRLSEKALSYSKIFKDGEVFKDGGGCTLSGSDYSPLRCIKGDKTKKPEFALVGDSHATSLSHELSRALSLQNKSFFQYTKNACPFAQGIIDSNTYNCDKYHTAYINDLKEYDIDTVIISSRWSYYINDDEFDNTEGGIEKGRKEYYSANPVHLNASLESRKKSILDAYRDTIISTLESGKKVILIYPIPEQGWDIPIKIYKEILFNGRSLTGVTDKVTYARNAEVINTFNAIGERKNLFRIYPIEILCNTFVKGRCASELNGSPLYYDDDHLSNEGAKILVEEIMKFVH